MKYDLSGNSEPTTPNFNDIFDSSIGLTRCLDLLIFNIGAQDGRNKGLGIYNTNNASRL